MIIYTENLKESMKKLLKLISDYSQVAEYKLNMQKSIAFLYTSHEKMEFKVINTIPIYISTPPQNEILRYKSNNICTRSI